MLCSSTHQKWRTRGPRGAATLILVFLSLTTSPASSGTAVERLEVTPDFHSVTLHWDGAGERISGGLGDDQRDPRTVVVTYCELPTWTPHRCKHKPVQASRAGRLFSARVSGLRMATRYSFQVKPADLDKPLAGSPEDLESPRTAGSSVTELPDTSVTAQTKGFSARATQCLSNTTEVEVDTGPFFGGRISVEPLGGAPADLAPPLNNEAEGTACSVWGDPKSPQSTYKLRFDHEACGGTKAVNRSAVATFLLVQESLPILTHSTRRFLVLCTAQPDTLTVSAGISLPGGVAPAPSSSVENSVQAAGQPGLAEPLGNRGARLLRNPAIKPHIEQTLLARHVQSQYNYQQFAGSNGAQLVLMIALVSTVAIGSGFAAWWVVRRHRQMATGDHDGASGEPDTCSTNAVTLSRSSSLRRDEEADDFSITTYENFASRNGTSSASEASSVLRSDGSDAGSCCSLVTDGGGRMEEIRVLQVEPPSPARSSPAPSSLTPIFTIRGSMGHSVDFSEA